jgi:hypothetical protein
MTISHTCYFTGQGYLSNISPSEYRQFYEEKLPESLLGSQFLENYGGHWDPVTEVTPPPPPSACLRTSDHIS